MTDAFTMFDEDHLLEDCCDILGVDEDATLDEIRAAFRQRAKILHPDRNRSASATDDFIRLGEAYRILREAAPRRVVDDRAEPAPVVVPPRPRWRAAGAVVVALVVSISAASTFAYLGLRVGPLPVAAPRVAEAAAPSAPLRETSLGGDARVAAAPVEQASSSKSAISAPPIPDVSVSGAQVSNPQVSNPDVAEADAFEALGAPAEVARAASTPSMQSTLSTPSTPSSQRPETDDALVASLVDSMDAPLADPQTNVATPVASRSAPVPGQDAAGPSVAAPQHAARRIALAPKLAAAPIAKPIVKPIVLRQQPAAPRLVRAYPWRPYTVRAAIYARYHPRVPVRHATVRRYQAQQWQAAPADWPF